MRVLLSAYACEPGKGSEPEVGWRWAVGLARLGHDVTVLTRANNRPTIEAAGAPAGVTFVYHDVPRWLGFWKRGRRGIHLYYLLWQWGAARRAAALHRARPYDRVHHVTFVGIRQPSFMGRLGITFTFGPLAGGETVPWRLRAGLGWRAWLAELARDVANLWVRADPLMARAFAAAETIVVTSAATAALVPARFRPRTRQALAIGIDSDAWPVVPPRENGPPRLLFVGQLIPIKGLDLALKALALARRRGAAARLTVIGAGAMARRWRALADGLDLGDAVTWEPWRPRAELAAAYAAHDVLVCPALRDSGGLVVLEALACGRPVIALDLGGPGAIVDESCGIKVAAGTRAATVAALADAIGALDADCARLRRLAEGAPARARAFAFDTLIRRLYPGPRPTGRNPC